MTRPIVDREPSRKPRTSNAYDKRVREITAQGREEIVEEIEQCANERLEVLIAEHDQLERDG